MVGSRNIYTLFLLSPIVLHSLMFGYSSSFVFDTKNIVHLDFVKIFYRYNVSKTNNTSQVVNYV